MTSCNDEKCPIHGKLKTHGNTFTVKVTSTKPKDTIIGRREYLVKIPKYERSERRHSKITAHKPECMDIEEGDTVKVSECKSISKKKHFVVTEKTEE